MRITSGGSASSHSTSRALVASNTPSSAPRRWDLFMDFPSLDRLQSRRERRRVSLVPVYPDGAACVAAPHAGCKCKKDSGAVRLPDGRLNQ